MNIQGVLDFVFPPRCVACNSLGSYLCCSDMVRFAYARLSRDVYVHNHIDDVFVATFDQRRILRKLVAAYKYRCIRDVDDLFVSFLLPFFSQDGVLASFGFSDFAVMVVPSSRGRIMGRGFHPMARILAQLSERCDFSVCDFVRVKSFIRRQQTLSREKRLSHLMNAFYVDPQFIPSSSHDASLPVDTIPSMVIILDDVLTTGATLDCVARILKEVGVQRVIGISLIKS